MSFAYFRPVTAWLFIHASGPLRARPAYLFATGSTPVPPDSEDSWPDYIPWHPSHGFTDYALRLTRILRRAFALGLGHDPLPRFIPHS